MAGRHANGEGTIYRRKDGRYEGATYLNTTSGNRTRFRVYGRTRQEAHDKLTEAKVKAQQGVPIPDGRRKLGDYLDYWLENFVKPNQRPKTYEQYECAVRLYLKPGLGKHSLNSLSVPLVQAFLNAKLAEGHSVRKMQIIRTTLSAALTRAQREELLRRNVARLVELPQWERSEVRPWSADEVKLFLDAARTHTLYPAFLLLTLYGLRRGEALGLRWCDIDFDTNEIRIRQQLQRIGRELHRGPVKTRAGQRTLPLLGIVREALFAQRTRQITARTAPSIGQTYPINNDALVFTTRNGSPIEPRNFVRSFWQICQTRNVRVIKLHHLRHTTATLLKNLGVPARDTQFILGHASIVTTQQLYQHDDMACRLDALGKVERLFTRTTGSVRVSCRQISRQASVFVDLFTTVLSGGPSGARTHDTLLKSSIDASAAVRATEVNAVVNERRKQWLLGVVAVSVAVKPDTNFDNVAQSPAFEEVRA